MNSRHRTVLLGVLLLQGSTAHAITWDQFRGYLEQYQNYVNGYREVRGAIDSLFRGEVTPLLQSKTLDKLFARKDAQVATSGQAQTAAQERQLFRLSQQVFNTSQDDPFNTGKFNQWTRSVDNAFRASIQNMPMFRLPDQNGVPGAGIDFSAANGAAVEAAIEAAQDTTAVGLASNATARSAELLESATRDARSERLREFVLSEGGTARTLEDRISAAVSTRAAVQNLGEGLADLMRQSVMSNEILTSRLTELVAQNVSTNQQLEQVVHSLIEQSNEEATKKVNEVQAVITETAAQADVIQAQLGAAATNLASFQPNELRTAMDGLFD